MRNDANDVALRALRNILDAAQSSDVVVAGKEVSCSTARQAADPWPVDALKSDHLESELGLSGVNREHGEVIDDEQLGADVASQGPFESAVQLGAVQVVDHAGSGHDDDAPSRLASLVGDRASEEGLAGAWGADEEGVDPLFEEGQIVEAEMASAHLLALGGEVEVEGVDGVDLGETSISQAPFDGALHAALLLLVAETMDDVERGEGVVRGAIEERGDELGHTGQSQPPHLLHEQVDQVVVALLHDEDSPSSAAGEPGSRVILAGRSWS
jgi:hypothetical protein